MRIHGRARTSVRNPRAHAICDRCGIRYNLDRLRWQYDWRGPKLQNLRVLVCTHCYDTPQEQIRTIVLPPDPVPVMNPRPELYTVDNNPISTLGTNIGTMISGGGLQAAFNGVLNKSFNMSANLPKSTIGYNNSVGKNWGPNVTPVISTFQLYAPNNTPFFGGGAVNYKLQGSSNGLVWFDMFTGTTLGIVGEVITTTLANAQGYDFHQIVFNGDGVNTIALSQFIISISGGWENI